MASNPVAEITSTIQSASLNRHPSPTHDINPSTAASTKRPVSRTRSISSVASSSSIPSSVLKPAPRRSTLPPLPDLRFEQSYLASLKNTETYWDVAWVTGRDQVLMPLVQGMMWTLLLSGWRHWNRGTMMKGEGYGAKLRRWWWGVNNWDLPPEAKGRGNTKLAGEVGDYYTAQLGTGHGD